MDKDELKNYTQSLVNEAKAMIQDAATVAASVTDGRQCELAYDALRKLTDASFAIASLNRSVSEQS